MPNHSRLLPICFTKTLKVNTLKNFLALKIHRMEIVTLVHERFDTQFLLMLSDFVKICRELKTVSFDRAKIKV